MISYNALPQNRDLHKRYEWKLLWKIEQVQMPDRKLGFFDGPADNSSGVSGS